MSLPNDFRPGGSASVRLKNMAKFTVVPGWDLCAHLPMGIYDLMLCELFGGVSRCVPQAGPKLRYRGPSLPKVFRPRESAFVLTKNMGKFVMVGPRI